MAITQLKFKINDAGKEIENGEFVWGASRNGLFEQYELADKLDDEDEKAEMFEALIDKDLEFIPAFNGMGWLELNRINFGNAMVFFDTGYRIGAELIPEGFKGMIPWDCPGNRPFLIAMLGFGLINLQTRIWADASDLFLDLLHYNPLDDQGVRCLLVESLIPQGRFEEIIEIGENYPDDSLADVVYGLLLAAFRLEQMDEAEDALQKAVERLPMVARELTKKKHIEIPVFDPESGQMPDGDILTAYEYWRRMGHYWLDAPLIRFIKSGLKKYG